MAGLFRYMIIGILTAEALGWLALFGLWQFYSISMTSRDGIVTPIAILAAGGAAAGLIAWALAFAVKRP